MLQTQNLPLPTQSTAKAKAVKPELAVVLTRLAAVVEQLAVDVPEGLDPPAAARYLGVSVSKLYDLNARGLIPLPAEVGDGGRCPRWSRTVLRAWLLAGCPARERWEAIRGGLALLTTGGRA